MSLTNITVLGTGVLGSQIAFQAAAHGKKVTAYDIGEAQIEAAKVTMQKLGQRYLHSVEEMTEDTVATAMANLSYSFDLAEAVAHADLVIEAVPEKLEIKRAVYEELAKVAPEATIFASNSSTLMPSQMADVTGRPDRFLALHFANDIWRHNIAEVMGHDGTDPKVFDAVRDFAGEIGMVPIEVLKEQPGYVLNSLLVPWLRAGADLLMKGVASPEDIDRTWRIATGSPRGPFEIYDVIGLTTAYNITAASKNETQQAFATYLKENFIEKGKLGRATGEGFYTYER